MKKGFLNEKSMFTMPFTDQGIPTAQCLPIERVGGIGMKRQLGVTVVLAAALSTAEPALANGTDDIWLLVETKPHVLKVMEGDQTKEVFGRIAIGAKGASYEKRRGDDKTPLGEYRIGWINANSKFHNFFGLTYPNMANSRRAYQADLIDEPTFQTLLQTDLNDSIPPQNTELGGQIGIHGIGSGSRHIHENFDWTHGCIALTNEQIDRLKQWVKKGTLVVIR
jgi:lipoprotein-anchoring transpeptidase ErfK/SrfK